VDGKAAAEMQQQMLAARLDRLDRAAGKPLGPAVAPPTRRAA
jgi:hypothetical protein